MCYVLEILACAARLVKDQDTNGGKLYTNKHILYCTVLYVINYILGFSRLDLIPVSGWSIHSFIHQSGWSILLFLRITRYTQERQRYCTRNNSLQCKDSAQSHWGIGYIYTSIYTIPSILVYQYTRYNWYTKYTSIPVYSIRVYSSI